MDKARKPINSVSYTQSSEPYRIQRSLGYVPTGRMVQIDTIMFADDLVLLASAADDL
jgi:hypothetical protein